MDTHRDLEKSRKTVTRAATPWASPRAAWHRGGRGTLRACTGAHAPECRSLEKGRNSHVLVLVPLGLFKDAMIYRAKFM